MNAPLPARPVALLAGFVIAAASLGMLAGTSLSTPAQARVTDNPLTSTLNAPFREWMSLAQVPAASVAIMRDGRLESGFGFGGIHAGTPTRIGSLSKAITAVCVAQLVDSGRLSFTAPLGTVLARTFATLGHPVDPRFRSITIEQLLMHRSGMAREPVQGPAPARDMSGLFTKILATPLADDPGGAMVYSNIGYITLGMVVQAVTGSDYERYCRDVALKPMQASGTIDPQLRHRAASGGWRVSAVDYARFIQVFEPGSAGLGPRGRAWQDALTGQRAYGLGIFIRRTEQGLLLTHTGLAVHRDRGGAYVIKFPTGWTAVVTYAGDARGSIQDLRRRLQTAIANL